MLGNIFLCHCLAFLVLQAGASLGNRPSAAYVLSTVQTYHVLSGDIEVRYKIPIIAPALQVQLIAVREDQSHPLAKMNIPRNTTSGIVIFPCGLLIAAENAAFRLVEINRNNVLAQSNIIDVKWPRLSVHVPLLVETYSSDVIVRLNLTSVSCRFRGEKHYATFVDLIYDGPTLTTSGTGKSVWHQPSVILSKELENWLQDISYDVTLHCENFDRAGYYKIRIRTDANSSALIAESDTIHVIWSHRYSVSVTKSSVEPCDESLKIIYHYPRCASDRDRLRVYGKMWRGVTKPLKYIFESRVHSGRHFTKISCDLFGEDLQEYCFSFVSTAKNGAVFELDTQCIPRLAQSDTFIPTWHDWGSWSDCSSTCGSGVHTRYRLCSSTKLNIGCEGKSVQTEICSTEDCPESTLAPSEKLLDLSPECQCGCQLNFTNKIKIAVDFNSCQIPTFWVLQTSPSSEIAVTILELILPSLDNMLIVRDGVSSLGSVLGIYNNANGSQVVYSSSPSMRIELFSPNSTSIDGATMQLLIISSETPRETLAIIQTDPYVSKYTLSTVHITMISLTIVLCSSAIFLTIILYFRNIKYPQTLAGSSSICSLSHADGSPNRQLLVASTSTSELSDSSLHRRSPKRSLTPSKSPEDYIHNSFLFKSLSSICADGSSLVNTPTPRRMHFNPQIEIPKSPPNLSPSKLIENEFDGSKKPLKSALKQKPQTVAIQSLSYNDTQTPSPVRRRGKPSGRTTRQIQRDSTTPLTASVSELSITCSEDDFEYDYYDYGCHDEPGSFFCPDPILVGWPPFIPLPPESMDDICDVPLQHFTLSPAQNEQDTESTKSQKDECCDIKK